MKARIVVTLAPWPAMMPDRIGTIGSTQGVNDSSSPDPKKEDDDPQQVAGADKGGAAVLLRGRMRQGRPPPLRLWPYPVLLHSCHRQDLRGAGTPREFW